MKKRTNMLDEDTMTMLTITPAQNFIYKSHYLCNRNQNGNGLSELTHDSLIIMYTCTESTSGFISTTTNCVCSSSILHPGIKYFDFEKSIN